MLRGLSVEDHGLDDEVDADKDGAMEPVEEVEAWADLEARYLSRSS